MNFEMKNRSWDDVIKLFCLYLKFFYAAMTLSKRTLIMWALSIAADCIALSTSSI